MGDPFIGEIQILPYNFAPKGWSFCAGQIVPVSQNPTLFSIIGSMYGGDWRVSMGLPNLQGRSPISFGQGPGLTNWAQSAQGGHGSVMLSEAQLPAHSHEVKVSKKTSPDSEDPSGVNKLAHMLQNGSTGRIVKAYISTSDPVQTADMASQSISVSGAGQAHNNRQPYLGLNFFIAHAGCYPSRT